jgi:hypothetical protein
MGWELFFGALPINYVMTDLNILEDDVKALQISPRIGHSSDVGDLGLCLLSLALAIYMRSTM